MAIGAKEVRIAKHEHSVFEMESHSHHIPGSEYEREEEDILASLDKTPKREVRKNLRSSQFLSALDLNIAVSEGVKKDHLLHRNLEFLSSDSESDSDSDTEKKETEDDFIKRIMRRSASPGAKEEEKGSPEDIKQKVSALRVLTNGNVGAVSNTNNACHRRSSFDGSFVSL